VANFFRGTLPLCCRHRRGCLLTFAARHRFISQSLIGGGQMLFMPMYLYQGLRSDTRSRR
jgi:putative spermidine/putrescine transport system permease protein